MSRAWITPVYSRTAVLVNTTRKYLEAAKNNGRALATVLRGAFQSADLLRIESNVLYLSETANKMGYAITTPSFDDIPDDYGVRISELVKITDFLTEFISNVGAYPETDAVPDDLTHLDFVIVNTIEKIIFDYKNLLDSVAAVVPYCGTVECGGV